MENAQKALALAALGIKVFPVSSETKRPVIRGGNGCFDATLDSDQIATWFGLDFVGDEYAVGYWAGGSNVLVLDIDKKNGKDGFATLAKKALTTGDTYSYPTRTSGTHFVFDSNNPELTIGEDVELDGEKLVGVDIRAGGGYAIWWSDEVPTSREAFSADIPDWVIKAATPKSRGLGKSPTSGFSGNIQAWLEQLPDANGTPSARVQDFIDRIPVTDFGHTEMVDLAWEAIRLGSERHPGIRVALDRLRSEWLRGAYNTAENRRDLSNALLGGIAKGGRVQEPIPAPMVFDRAYAMAESGGASAAIARIERDASKAIAEAAVKDFGEPSAPNVELIVELARARRAIFQEASKADLPAGAALSIAMKSKAFSAASVSLESMWFSDGEPAYHKSDKPSDLASEGVESEEPEPSEEEIKKQSEERQIDSLNNLAEQAARFTFLTEAEQELIDTDPDYRWWGDEYLEWVESELLHFNRPYHVGAMWAALSVIVGPRGTLPIGPGDGMYCNLYINMQGASTSGKSEALRYATSLIDAYYGTVDSPVLTDIKKTTALATHRALVMRDGKPSLVYSDEVQAFFRDQKNAHWQGTVLADMSNYYEGEVPPKYTLNDKETSGKRAKTKLTAYLTGIAHQSLDAINIDMWTDGLFLRFLWGFGYGRDDSVRRMKFSTPVPPGGVSQVQAWADEFKRRATYQEMTVGATRRVDWEPDAEERFNKFMEQTRAVVRGEPLYEDVFVAANTRFENSIMKVATIIALVEDHEKVTLRDAIIALSYAGFWHRSMVLAVHETGKDSFRREVDQMVKFMQKNAVEQVGKRPYVMEATIMQNFWPHESAERALRQLAKEGRIFKSGDAYEIGDLT